MFNPVATSLLLLVVAGPTPSSDDPRLRGASLCAGCHAPQAEAWAAGPHARAWRGLSAAHRSDARCVGCHTTGMASALQGVQCESCHGPADSHPSAARLKRKTTRRPFMRVSDGVCYRCHTADAPRALDMPADRLRVHPPSPSRPNP